MPFYENVQSLAGDFGDTAHETEAETDSNYEEVKHIVKTPFTMEHNIYSTTTHTSIILLLCNCCTDMLHFIVFTTQCK